MRNFVRFVKGLAADAAGTVKNSVAIVAAFVTAAVYGSAAMASETTPMEDLFAGADLSGVQDAVLAGGLVIITIATLFVGIKLVKRLVNKA